MSEHATEIDVAGAAEALEQRLEPTREQIEIARDTGTGRFAPRPAEAPTPAAGEAEAEVPGTPSPEDSGQADSGSEAPPSFTHIPDEALSPEMLAVKRAMQADYTRKTQEIAALRKTQEEFGFEDPAQMRSALEAYQTLSDPQNWPRLHQELTAHLQQQGLSPTLANEAAGVVLGEAVDQASQQELPDLSEVELEYGDGQEARLARELAEVKNQQAQLVNYLRQRDEQAKVEAQFRTLAEQMTQDEQVIRAAHKDMDPEALEEYIETAYNLTDSMEHPDLHKSAAILDSLLGRQASSWLTTKESAKRVPGVVPGAGVIAAEQEEPPHTLEEGHERAMDYVRRVEAQERQQAGF